LIRSKITNNQNQGRMQINFTPLTVSISEVGNLIFLYVDRKGTGGCVTTIITFDL